MDPSKRGLTFKEAFLATDPSPRSWVPEDVFGRKFRDSIGPIGGKRPRVVSLSGLPSAINDDRWTMDEKIGFALQPIYLRPFMDDSGEFEILDRRFQIPNSTIQPIVTQIVIRVSDMEQCPKNQGSGTFPFLPSSFCSLSIARWPFVLIENKTALKSDLVGVFEGRKMGSPSGGPRRERQGPMTDPFEESRMMMPIAARRFPITIASLALLAAPFGCGSETPAPPVVEASAPDTAAPTPAASTVDSRPNGSVIDPDVRQAAGDVEDDAKALEDQARRDVKQAAKDVKGKVHNARNGVKKAVEGAKGEAEQEAKAIEEDARKKADKALEDLLGAPK